MSCGPDAATPGDATVRPMPEPSTDPTPRQPYSRPELVELGKVDCETQFVGYFAGPGAGARGNDAPQ